MTVTITRLYDDHVSAERAVRDLEAAGIPHKDISIMSNNADSWYKGGLADTTAPGTPRGRIDRDHDGVDDRAEGAGTGAVRCRGHRIVTCPKLLAGAERYSSSSKYLGCATLKSCWPFIR